MNKVNGEKFPNRVFEIQKLNKQNEVVHEENFLRHKFFPVLFKTFLFNDVPIDKETYSQNHTQKTILYEN